jgi:hypothetical protein
MLRSRSGAITSPRLPAYETSGNHVMSVQEGCCRTPYPAKNFHPLINAESTGVRPVELLGFVRDCGHEP